MINLDDYIEKSVSSIEIKQVPTYSIHCVQTKKLINEFLSENPEYYELVRALVLYPAQKWASESREKVGLDNKTIMNALLSDCSDFFGIHNNKSLMEKQAKIIDRSEAVLAYIEDTLDHAKGKDYLLPIHGYKETDISKFLISSHYKKALADYCEDNCLLFSKMIRTDISDLSPKDDDIDYVFRRADLLLRLRSVLSQEEKTKHRTDYKKTISLIDACINCLDSYWLKNPKFKEVVALYSRGYKEIEIADKVSKSRTYVRRMIAEGSTAISFILWGYFNA